MLVWTNIIVSRSTEKAWDERWHSEANNKISYLSSDSYRISCIRSITPTLSVFCLLAGDQTTPWVGLGYARRCLRAENRSIIAVFVQVQSMDDATVATDTADYFWIVGRTNMPLLQDESDKKTTFQLKGSWTCGTWDGPDSGDGNCGKESVQEWKDFKFTGIRGIILYYYSARSQVGGGRIVALSIKH